MDIGVRIKKVREILNLSQAKFASLLGLTQGFLSNLETSYRKPDEQTLRLMEKELGISREWLENGKGKLFVDIEKALNYLISKSKYSNEEIFYILSQVQNIYSLFDSFLIRKEFASQISEMLQKFSLCEAHEITRFQKAIENEGIAWGKKMDEMLAYITNYIVEKDFNIPEELHKELQNLIFDWGMYVFIAAAIYEKYKFIPLESIYIEQDILRNIQKLKETEYGKQLTRVVVEFKGVKLLNFYGHFVLDFTGKGYVEFEKEKIFGFASAVLNVKNDEKKRVLDYEVFYTEVEKLANLKQKDITLSLSLVEFERLRECFKKIKENIKLWQWLQACYIEKYGFV